MAVDLVVVSGGANFPSGTLTSVYDVSPVNTQVLLQQ